MALPEMAPDTKNWRDFQVNFKVHLAQSKRFANGALEHYNKRKKIKFELVDVKPVLSVPEPRRCYTHMNFIARPSKEGSQEQLFFAELCHCASQRAPSGFFVTCCELLGPDCTVGRKFIKADGNSVVRKNTDFKYCFACTERISHPKGEKYVAGHCNIPYIYDGLR
ncbi:hypothetical protein ACP4OV_003171 [Aristida adscensionis]